MEVLCIDDEYSSNQLKWFQLNQIEYPKKDKIYTLRDVFQTSKGIAVHLEEIANPKVEIALGNNTFYAEPSFNIKRFANLNNTPLNISEILKISKNEKITIDVHVPMVVPDKLNTTGTNN